MNDRPERLSSESVLSGDVEDRFGVIPNFFRLSRDASEITERLWGFAKFGYLDSPLPSLFKERLFVYLSQFCEVRYCLARHVGFLIGLGHPAGDRDCAPETVEQVVRLIRRPVPVSVGLEPHIESLRNLDAPLSELPEPESTLEETIFACATHVFLQTTSAPRCLNALRMSLPPAMFEHLLLFLTFVRTAHFWTRVHPELQYEEDIAELLRVHEALAECVLRDPGAAESETTQVLLRELAELRRDREQAETLRVTLASIGDGVIATDSAGRITALNVVAEELTGWTNDEAVGKLLDEVFQIIDEQTGQRVESPTGRAMSDDAIVRLENDVVLISRNGAHWPIDDSAAPIRDRDENVIGCVLVFRDITERRRLERENEEADRHARFLAAIIVSSDDGIISKTLDGTIQSWNAAAERIFGYTADEAIGRHISMLIPHERLDEEDRIIAHLRAGERIEQFDTVRVRKDGTTVFVSLTVSPIKDGAGRIIGASKIVRDVTERKQAENERTRLVSVVENSSDFIGISDTDGMPLFINHAGRAMVGLGDDAPIGHLTIAEFFVPEEREFVETVAIPTMIEDGRWSGELNFRNFETGEAVPIWYDFFRVDHPETGQPINFATVTRNIADRKRAEKELRNSEEKFRNLADSVSQFAWMTDETGWIFWYNQRWFDYTGTTLEEMQGWGWQKVHHPDHLDRVTELFQRHLEQGIAWEDTFPLRGKDGHYRWFLSRAQPIRDDSGNIIRWIGTNTDIEELKRAELAAQKRSEQVRRLADVANRISLIQDMGSVLKMITEEARYVIGAHQAVATLALDQDWSHSINASSMSDKYASWNDVELPTDRQKFYSRICKPNQAVRFSEQEWREHPASNGLTRRSDNFPPMRGWLAAPLMGRDGRNLGLLQLSDCYEGDFSPDDEGVLVQLAQMASTAIENVRLVENLREADRRKDEFLATLSHELRNPLAPIRTGLEAMKLSRHDPDASAEILDTMERQVQQMVRLIDDLLDVSRITRGKFELRRCRVELAEVVRSAVEATRPFIDEAGHHFAVTQPPQPIYVDADPNRLAQVFSNLLNNAAKYTPQGGEISLSVESHPNEVLIYVRDNGLGIPEDMLDGIFEMFTQIDRPLEQSDSGLGIGLTLVKRLVEMHGGRVEVQSAGHNLGSEFRISLPVLTDQPVLPISPEKPTSRLPSLRILVVDDNKAAANMLKMVVKMLGNEVRTADDGAQAIRVAEEFLPDVILMDIGMPRMNGYEAAQHIRQQPWGEDMLLVALTGWGQEEDKERTRAAGFDHHLVKPAEPVALQELLASRRPKAN